MATGTLAHDVTVAKELLGSFIVELFTLHFNELAIVIKSLEEIAGQPVMSLRCGA